MASFHASIECCIVHKMFGSRVSDPPVTGGNMETMSSFERTVERATLFPFTETTHISGFGILRFRISPANVVSVGNSISNSASLESV